MCVSKRLDDATAELQIKKKKPKNVYNYFFSFSCNAMFRV